jgi:hypothetical protein
LSKRERTDFSRDRRQKNRSKWDADSTGYALNLTAKTKPLCLISFRHGGFFFSCWRGLGCEQRTGITDFVVGK